MRTQKFLNLLPIACRVFTRVGLAVWLAFCVSAHAQCTGLHAGITAQFVGLKPGYTEPDHELLTFLLINDSDSPVDVRAGSWKIVINGIELPDSDWIFGNGPMPTSGWTSLQAGQYFELDKALPVDKYFPHLGEYKVSWKGEGFRSSIITVVLSVGLEAAAQNALEKRNSLSKSCPGLHAGIRAQIIPPYTETPSVMLSFVLLNDSSTPIDVQAGSWKIFVDGNELNDSGMLFCNGLGREGGYKILGPGESYELAKSLPIVDYFLPNGSHKVSWKGTGFQSPTINVMITPASH